jgi:WD40 repeat protein
MRRFIPILAAVGLLLVGDVAAADTTDQPILRLDADGPLTFVSALAYGPGGRSLYEAGWDKVVRVWQTDEAGRWQLTRNLTYRIPIAAGLAGAINALAVSPDGRWLAVGGLGVVRGTNDLRLPGWLAPARAVLTDEMRVDQGVIYLFNTETREAKSLREHRGPIVGLEFAAATGGPPVLVSAGQDWDAESKSFVGAVRVWNVATGEHLAGISTPLSANRPALAAWRRGNNPWQTIVAFAWSGDEKLQVWDVDRNILREVADGQYNNTLAYWAAGQRLVTGSTERVKLWRLDRFPDEPPQLDQELTLPAQSVPRALALSSSRAGGTVDRIAMIVRHPSADQEDRLHLADLSPLRLLPDAVPLWNGKGTMPALAASAGSTNVAVAGGPSHQLIHLSSAVPATAAPQVVRVAASSPLASGFVRRGDVVGLILARDAQKTAGWIFDPQNGWTRATAEWKPAEPATADWQITTVPRADERPTTRAQVHVRGPQIQKQLTLLPGLDVTAVAMLPQAPGIDVPIAAVAAHNRGQPSLQLWDVRAGRPVRELTGHIERIRSLAFSADGALLASTANDGTTCLWKLSDLKEIVAARGMLPTVLTTYGDGRLEVTELAGEAEVGGLAPGDRLLGLVVNGELRTISSPADFYLDLSHIRPGDTAIIRYERGGAQHDATVRLIQGIDDRKPLVSLFLDAADRPDVSAWVAWSPLGPFESIGEQADPWIGWHFNTSTSPIPAKFAVAGEYRKLLRPGLLSNVLTKHELPREKVPPLPRPDVGIWLDGVGSEPLQLNEERAVHIARDAGRLHVTIDGLEPRAVASATWQRGDQPPQPLTFSEGNAWEAAITGLSQNRGEQSVRVHVVTREESPQTFVQQALVAFDAPLPTLELGAPYKDAVDEPPFTVKAEVASQTDAPANVSVRLEHRAGGKTILDKTVSVKSGTQVTHELTLEPGVNTIRWTARNELPDAQATSVERVITYARWPDPPPQIVLRAASGLRGPSESLTGELRAPWVVEEPLLQLTGTIVGRAPLVDGTIQFGDAGPRRNLTGFKAGLERLDVKEELRLQPGPQTIRVRAASRDGEPAEAGLAVEYRPQLPTIAWRSPAAEAVFVSGRDPREVELRVALGTTPDDIPFETQWLHNDLPVNLQPVADLPARTLGGRVELKRGENRFQVRLTNRWQQVRSESLAVSLQDPPVVQDVVAASPKVEQPWTTLVVRAASPAELPPLEVEVAGQAVATDEPVKGGAEDGPAIWTLTLRDVPLSQGLNRLPVRVRNADGWSLTAKETTVEVIKPPARTPDVEFLAPVTDATVDASEFTVRCLVRSESPLRRVVLMQDGKPLKEFDTAAQRRLGESRYELATETVVKLEPRDNVFELFAMNEGGRASKSRFLSYIPPPVQVVVDRLRGLEDEGLALTPHGFEAGVGRFDAAAPKANMLLEGRVRWGAQAATVSQLRPTLHVRVNGMLQTPIPLEIAEGAAAETIWRTPVCLTAAKNNRLDVELIGIEQDVGSRTEIDVDCAAPDTRQRLHLLVVGVNETDPDALQNRAMKVAGTNRVDGESLADQALSQGRIYGPLTGEVTSKRIRAQLGRICRAINATRRTVGGSDVVLFYYRGAEAVSRDGEFYLLTSESADNPNLQQSAISGDVLSKYFQQSPGAQLLLFDVQRKPLEGAQVDGLPAARWPRDTTVAALRFAWTRDGEVPNPARLLLALETAAPRAGTLDKLSRNLEEIYESAKQQVGAALVYERHVPPGLRALVLAQEP